MGERFYLCRIGVNEIVKNHRNCGIFSGYFERTAGYLHNALSIYDRIKEGVFNLSMEELQEINAALYQDIQPLPYQNSYANPEYAAEIMGEYGPYFSYLTAELYGIPAYIFENKLFQIIILLELFLEIYGMFRDETKPKLKFLREALYYHAFDYAEELVTDRVTESLDPSRKFAYNIIMESDLSDLRYLYAYGEYISPNEIKLAEYLNTLPDEEIDDIARTFTEGFRRGFVSMRIDLSKKKTVNIRYLIGQERIVRAAIKQFAEMGLSPILNRYAISRVNRRLTIRQGFTGTPVNRQFEYDHRMDDAVFLDADFAERKLTVLRRAYESMEELGRVYAGPAVIEGFGETPFQPIAKKEALKYSEKQQELSIRMASKTADILNQFIPADDYSFTIIAYPIPEIGTDFPAIFQETAAVNNLDNEKYIRIQQAIIDVLDRAEYVMVKGGNGNNTEMKIMLCELKDPEKETKFENCTADVNIPAGEVFTSPHLTGTEGLLHINSVYLNGLHYKNLNLRFRDGWITDYTCDNYEDELENRAYIQDNLLKGRDTLPIGEFAIGTNTTAYVMAKKYDILSKLPILIVEKMGPHFAIGDTCYSHEEGKKLYNPDGKEIVAKDNECSILRDSEPEKAYFNCHTDITIPYDEIGEIFAVDKTGRKTPIMKNGRFVLKGTEELNDEF